MKAKFKSKKTFEDSKNSTEREPKVTDLVDTLQFPSNEWVALRFVGPTVARGIHWIDTKKQDGSKTRFPKLCLAFDAETEDRDSTKACPWCDAEDKRIGYDNEYWSNAIVRSIQEDEPSKKQKLTEKEKESGFKEKGSKSWTPVRAVRLSRSLVRELKKRGSLNRAKGSNGESKAWPLSHPKYGCDVNIMFDPDEKVASKKYTVQVGDRTKITDEEEDLLMQDIENLGEPASLKAAKADHKSWLSRMGANESAGKDSDDEDEDESEDDEDEDDDKKSKSKKGKGKPSPKSKGKKSKDVEDEDEDDLDDEDEDEDEDEDDKKSKSKKKSKKPKEDEDEDEDEDDLDDDEDEDEDEDDKKSKSKSKSKKKSKGDDEDEDEDEDDLDEDEEDDKKSKKSKSKGKKDKKSKDDDEDDLDEEDDLDDDEDEEDDKKSKSKKSSSKSKSKGKKAKDDDEDEDESEDEEDDLDDEDEDEDDKKSKSKKSKKGKDKKSKSKGKKSKDDDDEDDLDEDDDD